MPTNLTGQMLGKVRVDMFLARGGMADVFVGTHTTLNRSVAIKFLKGDLQDEPDLRERFEREAQVIAMLRHPNIVQVFDFDSYENQPYLIMEYVAGATLAAYLRELHNKLQRLNPAQITRLLTKLASALQYAHDNNVIHRDIKPANILLTSRTSPVEAGKPLPDDVEPIITDFGLVRFTQSNKQTSTGVITGTPAYMSPEQALGDPVDARTDVYSLGVTVYEMIAGRIPFDSDSTLNLLHKQIYDPPPPILGISEELQEVMNRALAKNPNERFNSTLEFAEEFQKAIAGTSEASTLMLSESDAQPKPTQNNTTSQATIPGATPKQPTRLTTWIAAGLAGIVVLIVGITLFSRPKELLPVPSSTAGLQIIATNQPTLTEAPTNSSTFPPPVASQVLGLLRFQDGTAIADQVTINTTIMPLPTAGTHYEAWLISDDGEQRVSLGVIQFDANERGTLSFIDPRGRNLLGIYRGMEITIEPDPDNNPIPSGKVAFSAQLPPASFAHVRHLLYSFSENPNQIGFMDGLDKTAALIQNSAETMLNSFETGNQADVSFQAEIMLNAIVGNQSPDYKDWNNDGKTDDQSDGFGLLLNGDNGGYIQGALSHTGFAMEAEDATDNMKLHGGHVTIALNNISDWTPELRDALKSILSATSDADREGFIRQAVATANQLLNGVDINGNEIVEPIPGEGGVLVAYQHAYYMADLLIFADSANIAIPTLDPEASPAPDLSGYN